MSHDLTKIYYYEQLLFDNTLNAFTIFSAKVLVAHYLYKFIWFKRQKLDILYIYNGPLIL